MMLSEDVQKIISESDEIMRLIAIKILQKERQKTADEKAKWDEFVKAKLTDKMVAALNERLTNPPKQKDPEALLDIMGPLVSGSATFMRAWNKSTRTKWPNTIQCLSDMLSE